jgi:hypothetical protein
VTVEDGDGLGRELVPQPPSLRCPLGCACKRRAEDEARDPVRAGEGMLERERPAPRHPEDTHAVEAERRPDGIEFLEEELEPPSTSPGRSERPDPSWW